MVITICLSHETILLIAQIHITRIQGDIIRVANTVLIEGRRGGVTTGQALLNDDYQDLLHYNISCHFVNDDEFK
ncbi:unnamed protein product [Rhizophagus irregularis]|nr:unnamed protein product [Rhizophagus irregularis]